MNARNFAFAFSAATVVAFTAAPARAYQIESPISDGCHERLTVEVLDGAGWPDGREAPDVGRADRVMVEDLPFHVPERARDFWGLSLVIGARDNDVRGRSVEDFPSLSEIHNDPDGQAAHCLRSPWDDGAQGDQQALAECRAFILDEVAQAIGEEDEIDLDATEAVPVMFTFRGRSDVSVERFAFHAGRALHTLEDGFTHTFRSPDGMKVRHVTNWIDWAVDPHFSSARDGHQHLSALDICDDATDARRRRAAVTVQAGTALLDAITDGTGGREGRMARANAVLDEYFTLELGCNYENDWCDAPEMQEEVGCSAVPGAGPTPRAAWLPIAVFVFAFVVLRRRAATFVALCAGVVAAPSLAAASTSEDVALRADAAPRSDSPLSLAANVGVSLHQTALSFSGGVRYAVARKVALGIDAEWNPWVEVAPLEAVNGVANFYATGAFQLAKLGPRNDATELRTTVHLGASILLFDVVGARAGSMGPYVGWNLLGVAVPAGSAKIVIDPASVSLPIPQVHGVPFYYLQYRATIGVELGI